MTVNEAIEALKKLADKGSGECELYAYDEDGGFEFVFAFEHTDQGVKVVAS